MASVRPVLAVLLAATGCELYREPAPDLVTWDDFHEQVRGASRCYDDTECVTVAAPCYPCAVAVNQEHAGELEELASQVVCDEPAINCPVPTYATCEVGYCLLRWEPEPPVIGCGCNPVANTGCAGMDKCTFIMESKTPFLGRTDCAPAGTRLEGEACSRDDATGVDDCAGGLYCGAGVCTEVCCSVTNANCDADETCVREPRVFEDATNTGLCRPACDPVAAAGTGCTEGKSCYLNLTTGRSACLGSDTTDPIARDPEPWCDSAPATQGCSCQHLNTCETGYGCALHNAPVDATGLICAFLCDANASGGPACADGPGPAYDCRRINEFYGNTPNVPDAIGMCVDPQVFPPT